MNTIHLAPAPTPISLDAHPVRAYWTESDLFEDENGFLKTGRVELALGPDDAATFAGDLADIEPTALSFQPLLVQEKYHQKGAATRLISALAHVAITTGVEFFNVSEESELSLEIMRELFSEDRLQYMHSVYDTKTGYYKQVPWHIKTEHAIKLLEGQPSVEAKMNNPILLDIDLRGLDPSDFEAPVYVGDHNLIPDFSKPVPFLPNPS